MVRRAKVSGAEASFANLMLPHLDAAYNLARWLVRDMTGADDVVQTAMLRALDHFASFRGENARAWLLKIVRNTAYNWLAERRRGPQPMEADQERQYQETADPADDPETAIVKGEGQERLEQMLARLPPDLKECIVLREFEEMSYQEIADVTGVPIGTVMSRLWRARRILIKEAERSWVR